MYKKFEFENKEREERNNKHFRIALYIYLILAIILVIIGLGFRYAHSRMGVWERNVFANDIGIVIMTITTILWVIFMEVFNIKSTKKVWLISLVLCGGAWFLGFSLEFFWLYDWITL